VLQEPLPDPQPDGDEPAGSGPAEDGGTPWTDDDPPGLLPAAEDADEGDVDGAGEEVLKSPASGVLAGLLVGVVAWWSAW
jgi:hypothetical protein